MTKQAGQAIWCAPGEGVTVQNPLGGPLTFKARREQTRGTLTSFETTIAPDEGPPLHTHANEDEVLYVLEGTVRLKLEDEIRPAPAGAFAYIPRGLPHTWKNVGAAPARILVIFTPAAPGMETFFERFAELAEETPMPDAFRMLATAAGMSVLGPPLAESDPL